MKSEIDRSGYQVMFNHEGVVILITNDRKPLTIGRIIKQSDGSHVYKKSVKRRNLYRKKNGWAINYKLFRQLPMNTMIVLTDDKKVTYSVHKEKMNLQGSYLHFMEQGYEEQWFLALDHWNIIDHKKGKK